MGVTPTPVRSGQEQKESLSTGCVVVTFAVVGAFIMLMVIVALSDHEKGTAPVPTAPVKSQPDHEGESPAATPTLEIGTELLLDVPELDETPVAVDEQALEQTLKSVLARDSIGINQLVASGNVVFARSETPILLLDRRDFNIRQSTYPASQVRLLAGRQFAKSGWVSWGWLKPISRQTVRSLPMSREDVLENYDPKPQLRRTMLLPDGGTTYSYMAGGYMLVLTENAGRLICSRLIFDINQTRGNAALGLALALQGALFPNQMAGFNSAERENAQRLGLNAVWNPSPSEVTSHAIRIRRYIADSQLILEAAPESLPQLPPLPAEPFGDENQGHASEPAGNPM
jgi:hypothetical protein